MSFRFDSSPQKLEESWVKVQRDKNTGNKHDLISISAFSATQKLR